MCSARCLCIHNLLQNHLFLAKVQSVQTCANIDKKCKSCNLFFQKTKNLSEKFQQVEYQRVTHHSVLSTLSLALFPYLLGIFFLIDLTFRRTGVFCANIRSIIFRRATTGSTTEHNYSKKTKKTSFMLSILLLCKYRYLLLSKKTENILFICMNKIKRPPRKATLLKLKKTITS